MLIVMFISLILSLICASSLIINEWKENPRFKSFVISTLKDLATSPQFAIAIVLDVYLCVHFASSINFLLITNMIVVGYRVSEVLKHASVQVRVFHARLNFMPELPTPF